MISLNLLLTILSIVRSFVMGLKYYCWDKSGFASCKSKQFLQTRFRQSYSHRRIIGNFFLPLPDNWTLLKSYWTNRCLRFGHPHPRNILTVLVIINAMISNDWKIGIMEESRKSQYKYCLIEKIAKFYRWLVLMLAC